MKKGIQIQKWTEADNEQLAAMVRAGKTCEEIADVMGRDVKRVRARRQRLVAQGILPRKNGSMEKRRPFSRQEDEFLILGVKLGRVAKEIAADLGRPYGSVTARIAYLRRSGELPRDEGRKKIDRRRWVRADEEMVIQMYAAGFPVAEIAAVTGREEKAVRERVYERAAAYGLKPGERCAAKRQRVAPRALPMRDADIAREYLEAKDRRAQVGILAELNAADGREIIGAIVRGLKELAARDAETPAAR